MITWTASSLPERHHQAAVSELSALHYFPSNPHGPTVGLLEALMRPDSTVGRLIKARALREAAAEVAHRSFEEAVWLNDRADALEKGIGAL
jgi:hypothetical protein